MDPKIRYRLIMAAVIFLAICHSIGSIAPYCATRPWLKGIWMTCEWRCTLNTNAFVLWFGGMGNCFTIVAAFVCIVGGRKKHSLANLRTVSVFIYGAGFSIVIIVGFFGVTSAQFGFAFYLLALTGIGYLVLGSFILSLTCTEVRSGGHVTNAGPPISILSPTCTEVRSGGHVTNAEPPISILSPTCTEVRSVDHVTNTGPTISITYVTNIIHSKNTYI